MPTALISGITGQTGSYLADILVEKGYEVHGLVRRSSTPNTSRIAHLGERVALHHGDLSDSSGLARLVNRVIPDEVYHLGAQSHVKISFEMPEYTADITGTGTLRLLEALRVNGMERHTRFYNAGSSEMFGGQWCPSAGYNEEWPFHPRSPYGAAKVYSYWITKNYRESYGMRASSGILFNHESPRRGENFVTRKITKAIGRILVNPDEKLFLGNLDASRDWGYAREYAEAIWLMLQQDLPDDYVVATGETHTVREFLEEAFGYAGLDWKDHVQSDPGLYRPAEVDCLLGDARKAASSLGWKPKTSFKELVKIMVDADRIS